MSDVERRGDLFVLVADEDMVQTIKGLLLRPQSLKMARVKFDVRRHPGRDSGCRVGAAEYLRAFLDSYRHALVIFDLDGSGSHKPREEIEREVDGELSRNGWKQRAKAIVVEPELEIWVWGTSKKVPEVLGWNKKYAELRRWLGGQGLWPEGNDKPPDPKEAMRRTMRKARSRRSPRKFFELASTISLKGCRDPSFRDFKRTLGSWFPLDAEHGERLDRLQ